MLQDVFQQSFLAVLILSAIPLSCCMIGGLAVALLQAVFQIQEQSLGFLVKLGLLSFLILILGATSFEIIASLFDRALQEVLTVGKL